MHDCHFTKNFRDCICTEFYKQSRYKTNYPQYLFDRNPLFIKCIFLIVKNRMIRLSLHLKCFKKLTWWHYIDKCNAIRYLLIFCLADLTSDKYAAFDLKYISFCIQLNTFVRLGIANSFLFLIFPCRYFM